MNKDEIKMISRIIMILVDWSGSTADTPDDTEIIASGDAMDVVTLGDLKEVATILNKISG